MKKTYVIPAIKMIQTDSDETMLSASLQVIKGEEAPEIENSSDILSRKSAFSFWDDEVEE